MKQLTTEDFFALVEEFKSIRSKSKTLSHFEKRWSEDGTKYLYAGIDNNGDEMFLCGEDFAQQVNDGIIAEMSKYTEK